jgi:hypothetical protein
MEPPDLFPKKTQTALEYKCQGKEGVDYEDADEIESLFAEHLSRIIFAGHKKAMKNWVDKSKRKCKLSSLP